MGRRGMRAAAAALAGAMLAGAGCSSMKYGMLEKVGIHKRDVMVEDVKEAVAAQNEAKETFKTTLEAFSAVVKVPETDLERTYRRLDKSYRAAESKAGDVHSKINDIENVSKALFQEWRAELKQYESRTLRDASQKKYEQARESYDGMMDAMRTAAAKMDPVLRTFRDHVLFLKHNLNAQAIASIGGELGGIEAHVGELIASMEASIQEAQTFIAHMQGK